MEMDAYLECPGCDYSVRFHAPDVAAPPEALIRAWRGLLHEEHPRHPRPLPRYRDRSVPA
ncbi:hypothetical protein [Cryptosporangium phraense]|uniref:Uncharacterized protein n=1 Tax=Cryptosporangium phraense TaxID=2593070 RepID=A0A545AWG9_9ACTN|nr:hypothetical protein [Cryptosporangium phraense]TQS45668.1 hypothetical protein FL583_08070 [Cryptosporangium phraense]